MQYAANVMHFFEGYDDPSNGYINYRKLLIKISNIGMNLSAYLACLLCEALDMKYNDLFYIETKGSIDYWVPNIIGCPISGVHFKKQLFLKKKRIRFFLNRFNNYIKITISPFFLVCLTSIIL